MVKGLDSVDVSNSASGKEQLDLADIFLRVWARKFVVFLIAFAVLFGAIIYLHLATKIYTAEMRIVPSESSKSVNGAKLGGLGSLAAVAGVSVGSSQGPSTFEVFMATIKTREMSDLLARDEQIMHSVFDQEWNDVDRRWIKPTGVFADVKRFTWSLLGRNHKWHPPSSASLQEYLAQNLSTIPSSQKQPITLIQYSHRDPAFAKYMLVKVNLAADQIVRRKALSEARQYANYFERRLSDVSIIDLRQSIIQSLSEQEKQIMMTSSSIPYSMRLIEPPTVSEFPTYPRTLIVIAAAFLIGVCAGSIFVLAQWRDL
jgi:capsular polysaccharide biosynthesis protein